MPAEQACVNGDTAPGQPVALRERGSRLALRYFNVIQARSMCIALAVLQPEVAICVPDHSPMCL